MIKRGIQALAAMMVVTASPAYSQVVLSEDFGSGTFGIFTPSATGNVSINTGNGYAPCCQTTGSGPAMANYFAAFGDDNQPSGSLSLTTAFNATVNQAYELAFDLGALGGGSESFTFTVNGVPTTLTATANPNLDTTFTRYTYNFIGAGATTLSFMSGGVANVDAILDNVTISAVPELEVWAMMLFGFGAIGLQMRRRRTLQAVTA